MPEKSFVCLLTQRSVDKRSNMCQPGVGCEHCGWEVHERQRRADRLESEGLRPVHNEYLEQFAPGGRLMGLRLKAEADAARVDV